MTTRLCVASPGKNRGSDKQDATLRRAPGQQMPGQRIPDQQMPGQQIPCLGIPDLWCADEITKACRRLVELRPDLKDQLTIQGFAAGLPRELTGGEARNLPSRVLLALCDQQYRLLGIHVGVPHGDELISIVEDAEEVATTRQLRIDQGLQGEADELTVLRSLARLDRMWTSVLNELMHDLEQEPGDDEVDHIDRARLRSIGETLDAAYVADTRRRFGQTAAADQARLIQLEQHFETRQPWCDAMLALTVGEDFSSIWRDLVEMIWHYPPVTADTDVGELMDWINLQLQSDAVVLCLQPPADAQRFPWPPLSDGLSRRAILWQETHALALQHPFRTVNTQQLAMLIRELPIDPIDIQAPAMARYLMLEPGGKRAFLVRKPIRPRDSPVGCESGSPNSIIADDVGYPRSIPLITSPNLPPKSRANDP